jgi:hypothetical protein
MFFEIVSSCITTPLPAFLDVFESVLESTSWNAAELFCYGLSEWPKYRHGVGRSNARFGSGNKKKKS